MLDNCQAWVSTTAIAGAFVNGAPILAWLSLIEVIVTTGAYQMGSSIWIPWYFRVPNPGPNLILGVTASVATASAYTTIQFEPD